MFSRKSILIFPGGVHTPVRCVLSVGDGAGLAQNEEWEAMDRKPVLTDLVSQTFYLHEKPKDPVTGDEVRTKYTLYPSMCAEGNYSHRKFLSLS